MSKVAAVKRLIQKKTGLKNWDGMIADTRAVLKKHGIRHGELASAVGLSSAYVSRALNGHKDLRFNKVKEMCDAVIQADKELK